MKIYNLASITLTLFFLIFFKKIENFSINVGLSWTISKISPYFISICCGILLLINLKKIEFKNKIIKSITCTFALIIPFGISFGLHPIYQGDFSKSGQSTVINASPNDIKKDGLTVVSIPNCPFCFEAISKLKIIKHRNPKLHIEFIVCTKNKKDILNYIKESEGLFNIRTAENPDSLAKTAGYKFPVFIKVKDKKPTYIWSNDQFGVRAIDMLEAEL